MCWNSKDEWTPSKFTRLSARNFRSCQRKESRIYIRPRLEPVQDFMVFIVVLHQADRGLPAANLPTGPAAA